MRVSENTAFDQAINYVQNSKKKLEKSQEQVGTLKRLNKPSDDPIGMVRLLKLRDERSKITKMGENMDSARAFMNTSDGVLASATDIIMRSKELAIQQAGDVSSSDVTRKTVAEEIGQLYKQFLKIANTQVAGRHIFAGFRTDEPPFDYNGQYAGDKGEINVEMDENVFMPINMPGDQIFLGENRSDGETGIDIFGVLNRLKTGLLTNNKLMIQGTLEDLDYSQEQIIFARAKVGSRLNSLDRTGEMHLEKEMSVLDLISKVEDADVYKAFSDLTKNENILKATLASTAKVVQPSLLDFLR